MSPLFLHISALSRSVSPLPCEEAVMEGLPLFGVTVIDVTDWLIFVTKRKSGNLMISFFIL